jgi:hypothetical protein
MAGFLTDYLNNKVLDLVFGASAYPAPGTLYVGLSQFASNKAGVLVEPSGGGYARVAVANNQTNFPGASGARRRMRR